jgi:hypothetical protein
MYEKVLLDAMPNIFATTVRNLVNKELLGKYMSDPANSQCSPLDPVEGFIDFRDLLLKPDLAAKSGGSGKEPYGNVAYTLMTLVTDQLLATEDDGLASINSVLIRQLTEAQSGTKGTIHFEGDLLNMGKRLQVGGLDANVELKAYDARIENLDTVGEPLVLLDPVVNEPHLLNNTATFGVGPSPLRLGIKFMFALLADGKSFFMSLNLSDNIFLS